MKQSTIILFLFLLILNPSPAQRDWRLFDQFGFVHQIYQSADDSLWVTGVYGVWRYGADSWQLIPQVIGALGLGGRLKSIKTGWLHVGLWWKGNLAL